jgi:hypothetical protein
VTLFAERGTFSKMKAKPTILKKTVSSKGIDDKTIFRTRFNKYIDEIRFTLPNVKRRLGH